MSWTRRAHATTAHERTAAVRAHALADALSGALPRSRTVSDRAPRPRAATAHRDPVRAKMRAPTMPSSQRWLSSLRIYTDRRMLVLLALGFSSGLPFLLVFSTLSVWLVDVDLSIQAIGLFSVTRTPYALKFLWAPLVDRLPIPGLTRALGRRRSWMLVTQLGLAGAIAALGLSDPASAPLRTAVLALVVAVLSASQDIVIDAYRIDRLAVDEQGAGAAAAVMGYRLGMLAAGAGAFYLTGFGVSWPATYLLMAALMAIGVTTTLMCSEPARPPATTDAAGGDARGRAGLARYLADAVIAPFRDFMRRRGWLLLLGFVLLYKLGDALASTMTNVFLVDIGFSKLDIANIAKTYGLVATIAGVVLGGWLVRAAGVVRALWIAGFLQMGSNLMFSLQAWVGADAWLLTATIGVENLTGGVGTAAFVAYLSGLCNKAYSATQYALLTALAGMLRNFLAASTGVLSDTLGWLDFFLLTTAAAAPGLVVLYLLQRWR